MIKVLDRLLFHSKHWQLFIAFVGSIILFESLASWIFLTASTIYLLFIIPAENGFFEKLLAGVAFVSFIIMLAFIARAINALSNRGRAPDYFWEIFFLFSFPFFGVWFIQPRLNLLGDQFYR